VGALIFFALQQALAGCGAWYLVLLGAVAMLVTLFAPRGLWGTFGVALLPVGHTLDGRPTSPIDKVHSNR
jgi:branched-chain amino acid transport system permease protein